jgi:hypothetical protein
VENSNSAIIVCSPELCKGISVNKSNHPIQNPLLLVTETGHVTILFTDLGLGGKSVVFPSIASAKMIYKFLIWPTHTTISTNRIPSICSSQHYVVKKKISLNSTLCNVFLISSYLYIIYNTARIRAIMHCKQNDLYSDTL